MPGSSAPLAGSAQGETEPGFASGTGRVGVEPFWVVSSAAPPLPCDAWAAARAWMYVPLRSSLTACQHAQGTLPGPCWSSGASIHVPGSSKRCTHPPRMLGSSCMAEHCLLAGAGHIAQPAVGLVNSWFSRMQCFCRLKQRADSAAGAPAFVWILQRAVLKPYRLSRPLGDRLLQGCGCRGNISRLEDAVGVLVNLAHALAMSLRSGEHSDSGVTVIQSKVWTAGRQRAYLHVVSREVLAAVHAGQVLSTAALQVPRDLWLLYSLATLTLEPNHPP